MFDYNIVYLYILDHIFLISFFQLTDITFNSKPIETKFLFYCEFLRTTPSKVVQYLIELKFSLFELKSDQIEETVIKVVISEHYRCYSAQNVVIITDENIATFSRRSESRQIIIIHYCIS